MARYFIPKPIRRRWSRIQVAILVAGLAVGSAMFFATGWVGLPWPLRGVAFMLPAGIGAGLTIPPPNEPPLYRHLIAAWHYYRQPQRYVYDWRRGDWD